MLDTSLALLLGRRCLCTSGASWLVVEALGKDILRLYCSVWRVSLAKHWEALWLVLQAPGRIVGMTA